MSLSKERITKETNVTVTIDRGLSASTIHTGVGFLDHMLELFAFHGHFVLDVQVNGDTAVDDHHTVEDTGIVLGQLLAELGKEKEAIVRYGSAYVPMDESLARAVVDISGRPYLSFNAAFSKEKVGSFDVELVEEFFRALVINARYTVHIDLIRGGNTHHEIEAIFKAFAQALRFASSASSSSRLPSSKGLIE